MPGAVHEGRSPFAEAAKEMFEFNTVKEAWFKQVC